MRKPYIYTMPESFLLDQSVPTRWRLLAVINSFLLNGKDFYGSNSWLMEQLNCSQQTVSSAVAELERLGEITIERTASSRIIKRIIQGGDTNELVGGYKPMPIKGTSQLVPNSDSNSENRKATNVASSSLGGIREVKLDHEGKEKQPKINRRADPAWGLKEKLYRMLEDETGVAPTPHAGDYQRVKSALANLTEEQVVDMFEDALAEKEVHTVREVFTARAIDIYREENL